MYSAKCNLIEDLFTDIFNAYVYEINFLMKQPVMHGVLYCQRLSVTFWIAM